MKEGARGEQSGGMKPVKEMDQLIWDHLREFNKGDNAG